MEHCASGMDSENRIVVGKPDVSQGRKARSFLLYSCKQKVVRLQ